MLVAMRAETILALKFAAPLEVSCAEASQVQCAVGPLW